VDGLEIKADIISVILININKEYKGAVRVKIKWEFFDTYHKSVLQTETESTSDFETTSIIYTEENKNMKFRGKQRYSVMFNGNKQEFGDYYDRRVSDALEHSLLDLFEQQKVKQILKIDKESIKKSYDTLSPIILNTGVSQEPFNLYESTQNVVAIKRDSSYGTGCIVSTDGYIITTLENIDLNDVVEVQHNGKTYTADLIRENRETNLCLLKADIQVDHPFRIGSSKTTELVDEINIVAYVNPKLPASLIKGIISGKRIFNGLSFIQTDASVSEGNEGGALLNSRGELIGILNSKFSGVDFEGIGFSIGAEYITERLKLK
jgi:S1-C subfamily serine protease